MRRVDIDQVRWREIISNLTEKRNVIAKEFQEMIRSHYKVNQMDMFGGIADSINMNSQVQVMDLLNNKLRLNIPST